MTLKKKEFELYDSKKYWDLQYLDDKTGWDIGNVSPPLKNYIDQISDKSIKVLIPGAGNAYEAEYMHLAGFKNVYVLDISEFAVNNFKKRFPDFPEEYILNCDFFEHNSSYDLIIEQTFFCAINVNDRQKYFDKIYSLLRKDGKLVGLLFNHLFENEGPPFGGTPDEYLKYIGDNFQAKVFEQSYNSIKPRSGRELFINLIRK